MLLLKLLASAFLFFLTISELTEPTAAYFSDTDKGVAVIKVGTWEITSEKEQRGEKPKATRKDKSSEKSELKPGSTQEQFTQESVSNNNNNHDDPTEKIHLKMKCKRT